jgi:hypothetical protein
MFPAVVQPAGPALTGFAADPLRRSWTWFRSTAGAMFIPGAEQFCRGYGRSGCRAVRWQPPGVGRCAAAEGFEMVTTLSGLAMRTSPKPSTPAARTPRWVSAGVYG